FLLARPNPDHRPTGGSHPHHRLWRSRYRREGDEKGSYRFHTKTLEKSKAAGDNPGFATTAAIQETGRETAGDTGRVAGRYRCELLGFYRGVARDQAHSRYDRSRRRH